MTLPLNTHFLYMVMSWSSDGIIKIMMSQFQSHFKSEFSCIYIIALLVLYLFIYFIYTWSSPRTSTKASSWWRSIGLFANSSNGLVTLRVKGRNLVPYPPTSIRAFILDNICQVNLKTWIYLYSKKNTETKELLFQMKTSNKCHIDHIWNWWGECFLHCLWQGPLHTIYVQGRQSL